MSNKIKKEAPTKRAKENSRGSGFKPADSYTTQFTQRQSEKTGHGTNAKKESNG